MEWHYSPELPERGKMVIAEVKYDNNDNSRECNFIMALYDRWHPSTEPRWLQYKPEFLDEPEDYCSIGYPVNRWAYID